MRYLFLIFVCNCGTTLISEQERVDYSVATMYLDFSSGFLKEAYFINRETGKEYSNTRYGWGKEFFPREDRYSFLTVGNLPPGVYELSRIYVYHISTTKIFEMPKNSLTFNIDANEIKFIGHIQVSVSTAGEPSTHVSGRTKTNTLVNSAKEGFQITHEDAPDEKERFRDGEEFFLEFFISKKSALPKWADIAKKRLAAIELLKAKL